MGKLPVDSVILVHGLWYGPWSMKYLGRGLRHKGYECRYFKYSTRKTSLGAAAKVLRDSIEGHLKSPVHLVGHSLGGLVILKLLMDYPETPQGNVVLLGSPINGSRVARKVAGWPGMSWAFGASESALAQGYAHLPEDRKIGMIRGQKPVGLGRIAGGFHEANDGTVSFSETHSERLADEVTVKTTHTGLIMSREVLRHTVSFLSGGRFAP